MSLSMAKIEKREGANQSSVPTQHLRDQRQTPKLYHSQLPQTPNNLMQSKRRDRQSFHKSRTSRPNTTAFRDNRLLTENFYLPTKQAPQLRADDLGVCAVICANLLALIGARRRSLRIRVLRLGHRAWP